MNQALSQAQAAIKARQLPRAEQLCRQVLFQDPGNLRANLLLAQVFRMSGSLGEAERLLRVAVEKNPTSFEAQVALGSFLHSQERFADAAEVLKRAVTLDPYRGGARYLLGICFLRTDEPRLAAESLRAAVQLTPNSVEFHHFLGVALERIGCGADATRSFREAIRIDPAAALSNVELGNLLLAMGDSDGAVACFKRTAELQPRSAKAQVLLAKAYAEEQKFTEAQGALDRAIRLDPRLPDAYLLQGRLLQQLGKFEEARVSLNQGIELNPDGPDGYFALINGSPVSEQDRPLILRIEKIVGSQSLKPADLRLFEYALGKAYDDLGEYEPAMKHFDRANLHAQTRMDAIGKVFDLSRLKAKIDRTVDSFPADRVKRLMDLGDTSEKPIFVVGMARSGTTLVEQIISSHPDIGACGELGTWVDLGIFGANLDPGRDDVMRVAAQFLERVDRIAPSCKRVTVKTPQNYLVLGQILGLLPNCRIVHCKRNAIDTCLSIYTTPFYSGPEFAHKRESLVAAYREYLRVMGHWEKVIPADRLMTVQYEELVTDPAPVLKKLVHFLGVEWSDDLLEHQKNKHAISTPSVWQARQPLFKRSVGRRKHYEPWLGPLLELDGAG
jgi:tetratricopeptide (TPR) repeat protein